MQGRVGGLYNYVFLASGPVGSLLAGWLAEVGGAPLAFAVGGVTAVAVAGIGALWQPWPMPTGTVRARRHRRRVDGGASAQSSESRSAHDLLRPPSQ